MEQTIIQSTKDVLKKKVNFFEQQQKERIITACKSDMKYAEVLAFIKNEIEMSEQNVSLKYNIKCWKTDGAFQFNRAVEEIFGSVKAEREMQVLQALVVSILSMLSLLMAQEQKYLLVRFHYLNLVKVPI